MTDLEQAQYYMDMSDKIIKLLPEEPYEALSVLCTLIDMYGHALKLQHKETWKMVNDVKDLVYDELGEVRG